MLEIVFYGRGGQGCLVASKILARALFSTGKEVQTFPAFGGERRGAPVKAFLRVDDRPIRRRSLIYRPAHALVLNDTLLDELSIVPEIKGGLSMVINTTKSANSFSHIPIPLLGVLDADAIARDLALGTPGSPIVNTIMLGAHLALSAIVDMERLTTAIQREIDQNREKNIEGAVRGFNCLDRLDKSVWP